ncbi:hypothetical protein O1Q96_32850 [Streptomyces sp. Qhu-G9]|nr:hypothetical protein [Streptomyces aurantiacus]WAU86508.1 hypothetical protein O1Q96_32850 [Streptomyces aurantiacus]
MRRTARVLSATALTALSLGTAAAAAAANPAAEVSPRTVAPGGTVTVSVSCEPTGGPPPETIDATSQAFEHGTVQLHEAQGGADGGPEGGPEGKGGPAGGPAYSGTARIAPAANFEDGGPESAGKTSEWSAEGVCPAAPGGEGKQWSASFTVSRESSRGTGMQHGVHAGEGGAFTDSTIALVTGGVLIAGAFGAAVHKLRHRESSADS